MPGACESVVFELGVDVALFAIAGAKPALDRILQCLGAVCVGEKGAHIRVEVEALANLIREPGAHDLAAALAFRDDRLGAERRGQLTHCRLADRGGLCELATSEPSRNAGRKQIFSSASAHAQTPSENCQLVFLPVPALKFFGREFRGKRGAGRMHSPRIHTPARTLDTMIDVVFLDAADTGEVLTLQRAAFAYDVCVRYPGYTAPVTQTLQELHAELSVEGSVALGIRDRGRLVASVRLRRSGPDSVYLGRLVVAPDRAGEGLGAQIMTAVDDVALPRFVGARRIDLTTDGQATWLVAWYQRLGYRVTARGTSNSPHEWCLSRDIR